MATTRRKPATTKGNARKGGRGPKDLEADGLPRRKIDRGEDQDAIRRACARWWGSNMERMAEDTGFKLGALRRRIVGSVEATYSEFKWIADKLGLQVTQVRAPHPDCVYTKGRWLLPGSEDANAIDVLLRATEYPEKPPRY